MNDKGESDGFEVAVLKEVDKLLPQYEFKFVPTSDDDLLIGIESGKYDLGTKGAWVTAERKKKFVFPKNPVAASIIGISYRTADAGKDQGHRQLRRLLAESSCRSRRRTRSGPSSRITTSRTPTIRSSSCASESFSVSDAYQWVLEGRYDAYFDIKLSFLKNVKDEKGPYHAFADKLSYAPYKGIPTWPLFNKKDQALADAYDKAIDQLRANERSPRSRRNISARTCSNSSRNNPAHE